MKALVEPIAAVLRVVAADAGHGAPYTFATTVRWVDRHTVELVGAMRSPSLAEARAIRDGLREHNVRRVFIRRWRNGKEHTTVWRLRS